MKKRRLVLELNQLVKITYTFSKHTPQPFGYKANLAKKSFCVWLQDRMRKNLYVILFCGAFVLVKYLFVLFLYVVVKSVCGDYLGVRF